MSEYVLFNMKNDCFLHDGGKGFWWHKNISNVNHIDTLTVFAMDSSFSKVLLCTMEEKDIILLPVPLVKELRKFDAICLPSRGDLLMVPFNPLDFTKAIKI